MWGVSAVLIEDQNLLRWQVRFTHTTSYCRWETTLTVLLSSMMTSSDAVLLPLMTFFLLLLLGLLLLLFLIFLWSFLFALCLFGNSLLLRLLILTRLSRSLFTHFIFVFAVMWLLWAARATWRIVVMMMFLAPVFLLQKFVKNLLTFLLELLLLLFFEVNFLFLNICNHVFKVLLYR